jgi:NitT/TauT family transport system permease protein
VPKKASKKRTFTEWFFSKFSLAKPKEIAKLVCPLIAMVAMMIINGASADVYPESETTVYYPIFIRASIVIYLVIVVISIWFEYFRRHFVKWWGLIIFLYMFSGIYNMCTLKSGIFELPYFPSFESILKYFFEHYDRTAGDLYNSVTLYLQGITMGGVLGFLWGSAMGYSKHANYWLSPIIKIIGPVPGVAWVTISLVLAPSNHFAALIVIASTTWFPLSVNLAGGIRSVSRASIERAQTLGASNWYIIRHVVYPAAAPSIFTGLFMAFCFSLTSLVTAEVMGVEGGLGWRLSWAQSYMSYDIIYAVAITFILMAFVLITILFIVQRHTMSWSKEVVQW